MNKLTEDIKNSIPEDTSIFDLAESIGEIIIEEYGEHNYKHFVETICKKLASGINSKIAMEILRTNGYYSTNLWHIDDIVKTFDHE
jgi:hypothetical protein